MSSNIQTEAQLVRAMGSYIIDRHTDMYRLFNLTNEISDERSKRINELSFDIMLEIAFKAYDKEFKTIVGDEEE